MGNESYNELLLMRVENLPLAISRLNFLHNRNLVLIGDVVQKNYDDFHPRIACDVSEALSSLGLSLGMELDSEIVQKLKAGQQGGETKKREQAEYFLEAFFGGREERQDEG